MSFQTRIYILKLKKGKWFVGRCTAENMKLALSEHESCSVPGWTSIYGPGELYWTEERPHACALDSNVKEHMVLHGIENVRGGSYSDSKLSEAQRYCLEKEMRTANRAMGKIKKQAKTTREVTEDSEEDGEVDELASDEGEEDDEDEDDEDFIDDGAEEVDKESSSSEEEEELKTPPKASKKRRTA